MYNSLDFVDSLSTSKSMGSLMLHFTRIFVCAFDILITLQYLNLKLKIHCWQYQTTLFMQGANLNRKIQNVVIDTQFLQKIIETSLKHKATAPENITQLGHFLRIRNSKYSYTKKTRETSQQWMKKKGVNVQPLIDKIKIVKEQRDKKQQDKKAQTDCFFYLPELSLENQQTYLSKNFQYGVFSTIQSVMSSQKYRGNFVKRIIEKRKNHVNMTNELQFPIISTQSRDKGKKDLYIQVTKKILKSYNSPTAKDFVESYKGRVKEKFWEIMQNHILALGSKKSQHPLIPVMIASLKMVESQFHILLPHSYESLLYYVTNNYLNKVEGNFYRDDTFGPIWALAYFNYRAGRKDQFYRCLTNFDSLRTAFQECDKSIRQGWPKMGPTMTETQDIFHRQLLYALKGVPLYADETVCDPNTLDIVWVFLRNVGIFGNFQKYDELRKSLFLSYSAHSLNQVKIKNLLYLTSYPEIVQVGVNEMMDQDDFLHFLITLTHCEELMFKQHHMIRKKLTENIIIYIYQLMMENRPQYLMYMLLMPEEDIPNEVSSIISSSQLLQKIKWNQFKENLSEKTYERLVKETLNKYADQNQNYVLVAQKYCELLKESRCAIEFILQMMIKSVLLERLDQNEIARAQRLVKNIFKSNQLIERQYKPVFRLFEENRMLMEANMNRDRSEISKKLHECEHILINEQLSLSTSSALNKLIDKGGFEVYIVYIKNALKSYELLLLAQHKINELNEVQMITLNSLNQLLKRQPYYRFAQKQSAVDLVKSLQQKLYSTG